MNLTPEQRGVRWPWNFVEAPLTKPVPKHAKEGCTSRGYNDTEEEKRHVKRQRVGRLHVDGASMQSI